MRRTLLSILTGALTGVLVLGVAWATAGLIPVRTGSLPKVPGAQKAMVGAELPTVDPQAIQQGVDLPSNTFLVGAHNESIAPIPISEGGQWKPDKPPGTCKGQAQFYLPGNDASCLRTFDSKWATGVDEAANLGVFARAMAISNGKTTEGKATGTIVFVTLDTVSWFYGYNPKICPDGSSPPQDTCGSRAITQDLSAELGIPAENMVIASTHTHASADTTAATPSWYYTFVRNQIKDAIRGAVASMQPAVLETGAIPAKAFNTDRRIVTRAVPDYELTWLRAIATKTTTEPTTAPSPTPTPTATPDGKPGNSNGHEKPGNPHQSPTPTPAPVPSPTPAEPTETIATLVNYSVHPTVTAGNADMHSGLVGHLAERLNQLWGGSTVFMSGGLGDQTVNRGFGRKRIGYGLAELIHESGTESAYRLRSNDIVAKQRILTIPADNESLIAANLAGIFVRDTTVPGPHAAGPSESIQKKGRARTPSCTTVGRLSVLSPVGGIRIGTPGSMQVPGDQGDAVVIMQTPGEIFSSISLTTKDYLSRTRNVMVFGMANDHIGYIIPKEQYDTRGANAVGIAQPSIEMTNYEESLSTGSCTGDQVQNALIEIGTELNVLGNGEAR